MTAYKNIKISDFTYDLPEERIAKYPLPERDNSRLLISKDNSINEDIFRNVASWLPEGSQLVFNNTRVIHARLFFRKESGALIEVFCLEPVDPVDYQVAFLEKERVVWKCMVGNSKKWKTGKLFKEITIDHETIQLSISKIHKADNTFHIEFKWDKQATFSEIIEHAGILPIPPYLKRETEKSDEETYQTVYARIDGSVAAPTAGLHFTNEVMKQLPGRNIVSREITLHVGAGTFQPVKAETISGHTMHHELVIIPKNILYGLLEKPENIIAVGTTSVRSLESLYWLGLQIQNDLFNPERPEVLQWEPYEKKPSISSGKALQNIIEFLENIGRDYIRFSTQIIMK